MKQAKNKGYHNEQVEVCKAVDACIKNARKAVPLCAPAPFYINDAEEGIIMKVGRILQPLLWQHTKTRNYIREQLIP